LIIFDGWCHLSSTESEEELHSFAKQLGLRKEWYHTNSRNHPHYDLTTKRKINEAICLGAKIVTPLELLKTSWWAKVKN
jgi:hypothetical protein